MKRKGYWVVGLSNELNEIIAENSNKEKYRPIALKDRLFIRLNLIEKVRFWLFYAKKGTKLSIF